MKNYRINITFISENIPQNTQSDTMVKIVHQTTGKIIRIFHLYNLELDE